MSQANLNYIIGCILIRFGLTTPEELEALRVKLQYGKQSYGLMDWREFLGVSHITNLEELKASIREMHKKEEGK